MDRHTFGTGFAFRHPRLHRAYLIGCAFGVACVGVECVPLIYREIGGIQAFVIGAALFKTMAEIGADYYQTFARGTTRIMGGV